MFHLNSTLSVLKKLLFASGVLKSGYWYKRIKDGSFFSVRKMKKKLLNIQIDFVFDYLFTIDINSNAF
jgi:hypothetical protein